MKRMAVICVITASLFFGSSVWASPCVLDQFQVNQNYGYAVGDSTMMAQTFMANLEGVVSGQTVRLCHIEIGNTTGISWGDFLGEPSPPVVEIRNTTEDGRPGSILGSVTWPDLVPSSGWTLPISFLDQGIVLTTGQMYSIVLWADDQSGAVSVGAIRPDFDPQDPVYPYPDYGGGALWAGNTSDNVTTWRLLSGLTDIPVWDMQFRTYVVPVPLPAGVWLGICAVGVAGWHLKRQRG